MNPCPLKRERERERERERNTVLGRGTESYRYQSPALHYVVLITQNEKMYVESLSKKRKVVNTICRKNKHDLLKKLV